ncbi:MAG: HAD family hydrolase [Anaerorhabdus sp.]|uniref:HAD family hydrolase n=1 Tax=Anaerorhabdus sp. TaxID=1872524 RepID=UPI002FCB7E35
MIKLIACDLDGTIIRQDNTLSIENEMAIKLLEKKKITFLPCTGRCYQDMRSAFPQSLIYPSVLMNGALFAAANGSSIYHFPIKKDIVLDIVNYFQCIKLSTAIYSLNTIYMIGKISNFTKCLVECGMSEDFAKEYYGCNIIEINSIGEIQEDILKIEIMIANTKVKNTCQKFLSKCEDVNVSSSLPYNIEITAKGIHKAAMLRKVAKFYGIKKEEILVFGDSMNDYELFENYPNTVAPKNADEAIIKLSKFQCETCENNGFSSFVRNYFKM